MRSEWAVNAAKMTISSEGSSCRHNEIFGIIGEGGSVQYWRTGIIGIGHSSSLLFLIRDRRCANSIEKPSPREVNHQQGKGHSYITRCFFLRGNVYYII
jgi:hypothetical protein